MGGRTTFQVPVVVEKEMAPLDVDAVVIYSMFNYHRHSGFFDSSGKFEKNRIRSLLGRSWGWLYNHSLLFASFYEKFALFREKSVSHQYGMELIAGYEKLVGEILDLCREKGITPIIVKQPLYFGEVREPLQDREAMAAIGERIKAEGELSYEEAYYWLQSHLLDVLDAMAALRGFISVDPVGDMELRQEYFYDIVHLSEAGNARLAEIIYESIKDKL